MRPVSQGRSGEKKTTCMTVVRMPDHRDLVARIESVTGKKPFNILVELASVRGLMTVEEVALLLRKSEYTIYRMAQKRRMPSLMIGG